MTSTRSVCGDFTEPTFTDYGRCKPRRLKKDCRSHVPTIPGFPNDDDSPPAEGECVDGNLSTEFDSGQTPPLRTIASVFDENCEVVEDPDGNPITGPIV